MTRRRYVFDEARVQKFIAEGRGNGEGPSYRPWLQIQDVPSMGRSHRPLGIKTARVHHLLSDGEWKSFLMFEADKNVVDIREQFPLDRLQTYRVARKLGYRHPVTMDGTPYVMTVDFVVTIRTPHGHELRPYTFKYDPHLLKPRERELIEIAQEFWRQNGHDLVVLDQSFFDEALILNYESVRTCFDISPLAFYRTADVAGIASALRQQVRASSSHSLGTACRQISHDYGASPQVAITIAKHLIARGVLRVNLSHATSLDQRPLHEFEISSDAGR